MGTHDPRIALVLAFLVMQTLVVLLMLLMLFVVFHNAGR